MVVDDGQQPAEGGLSLPLGWTIFALAVSILSCAAVGASAYNSESAGVTATYAASLPIGFAVSGAIGAVVTHFLVKPPSAARTFVPVGCGCLGGVTVSMLTVVFFMAIFPAL